MLRELGYNVRLSDKLIARNNADIAWIQNAILQRCPIDSQPKICYERHASGTVGDAASLLRSDVFIYTKEIGYITKDRYLTPLVDNRHHTTLIAPDLRASAKSDPILNETLLDKISILHPIYRQEARFSPYFSVEHQKKARITDHRKRSIDVFFSGNVYFRSSESRIAGPLITQHRKTLVAKLSNSLPERVVRLIGIGKALSPDEFRKQLLRSKIFVSPYGWGEYSWKDFEAALSGCILVKPQSSFLKSYGPALYQNAIVECQPDYSDLPEVIDRILCSLNQFQQRAQAMRKELVDARTNDQSYAADIALAFSTLSVTRQKRKGSLHPRRLSYLTNIITALRSR